MANNSPTFSVGSSRISRAEAVSPTTRNKRPLSLIRPGEAMFFMGRSEHRISNIQHRTSNIEHSISNIQYRTSNIKHTTLNIELLRPHLLRRRRTSAFPARLLAPPASPSPGGEGRGEGGSIHRTSNIQRPQ